MLTSDRIGRSNGPSRAPSGVERKRLPLHEPTDDLSLTNHPFAVSFFYRRVTRAQVEGSCTGRHGFIVMVTQINRVSEGMVTDDGTARAAGVPTDGRRPMTMKSDRTYECSVRDD